MLFCCPVCGGGLERKGGSLVCPQNHCFDLAKSGYVNLLTADRMHSKTPGDDKRMVKARRAFLDGGWYRPLLDALCTAVTEFAGQCASRPVQLLDVGCGEGYYTAGMAAALERDGIESAVSGLDISKTALALAARREPRAFFAVGSVFHLPLPDESIDLLTELFAPFCREECYRVLKPGGIFLMAIPNRRHLFELKEAVYERPYENEVRPFEIEGFEFLGGAEVESALRLERPEEIQNLFLMTPYAYRTSPEDTRRLEALERLDATASFLLLQYRKRDGEDAGIEGGTEND